jgi:hypothetical protein
MRVPMKFLWLAGLLISAGGQSLIAQDGRSRVPSNATAKCGDGTYSTAKTKSGVCSAHGGVDQWLTPSKTSQRSSGGTSSAQVKRNGRVPSNATAKCSDGTYSTAKSQQGACSQHGGVDEWLGSSDTNTPTTPSTRDRSSDANDARTPSNATAKCSDGTYSTAKSQQGACSQHGGVAEWLGATEVADQNVPESADGATARCADGSYTQTQGQGACSSHGGVAEWLPEDETVQASPTTNQSSRTQGDVPAEATARCKDGTYSRSTHRSGTCSYHGGVAEWLRRPAQD